jgi:hypothetical protein
VTVFNIISNGENLRNKELCSQILENEFENSKKNDDFQNSLAKNQEINELELDLQEKNASSSFQN